MLQAVNGLIKTDFSGNMGLIEKDRSPFVPAFLISYFLFLILSLFPHRVKITAEYICSAEGHCEFLSVSGDGNVQRGIVQCIT